MLKYRMIMDVAVTGHRNNLNKELQCEDKPIIDLLVCEKVN
jgi:hypothetical protein